MVTQHISTINQVIHFTFTSDYQTAVNHSVILNLLPIVNSSLHQQAFWDASIETNPQHKN